MTVLSDYVSGTISLTNGEVEFTGAGTAWQLAQFKEGDTIIDITGATEFMGVVATIDANGAGTLTKAWEGPTLVDAAYRMRYQPDNARVSAQARNLIELLGNGNLQAMAGLSGAANRVIMFTGPGTMTTIAKTDLVSGANYDVQVSDLAGRTAYDAQAEGFAVLVANTGDGRAAIYSKLSATSGDWSGPAYVTGPTGALPDVTVGDVTTGAPGTDVEVVATPTMTGVELDFTIPAGEGFSAEGNYSGGTAYAKGDVVQQDGSSWVALQATTGNAPPTLPTTSNAYWQLLARQGVDGAGTVSSVAAGVGVSVNSADPTAPVVALANMANATVKGRNSSGTGAPEDVTMTQLLTLLKAAGAYAKDNVLGAVAFAGGVNTGAVIETGSNANGKFIRFADGTQVCWGRVTASATANVPYWGGYRSAGVTVTYPAVFNAVATVIAGQSGDPGLFSANAINTGGTTEVFINFTAITSQSATTAIADWIAIGRWRA